MTKLIVAAVAAVAACITSVIKLFHGKQANKRKIRKLQEKVDAITKDMFALLLVKPFNQRKYRELIALKRLLNKQIARLRDGSG